MFAKAYLPALGEAPDSKTQLRGVMLVRRRRRPRHFSTQVPRYVQHVLVARLPRSAKAPNYAQNSGTKISASSCPLAGAWVSKSVPPRRLDWACPRVCNVQETPYPLRVVPASLTQ